ncbi:hypothetical protein GCM10010329_56620 [Streptomyces spiroverticillatus]|uniref:Uncharacterized protein n=1 Tax=Streptomyces finlayi TaxID=67296 RepID=A0A918X291_9ACTN|nr:hypothetical protein [Streptomyces finlayi]GHA25915.1 hypothetical protein GCM10010329_56620 [Streptomyces spiroverticillatus]GHD05123.1 hypothetical protein GCM10010334_55190 [Streptomyces finlayi]
MKLEALRHGNFAALDAAVREWGLVIGRLKVLEQEARDGLRGRAERAQWAGEMARVTREFVRNTAGEFGDARTQATSIHNVLRDTRDELVRQRGELRRAIERGEAKHLQVVGVAGGGFKVLANAPCTPGETAAQKATREKAEARDVAALRDELQRILNAATESDTSADRVLRALVAQAERGFASGAAYRDRDAAAGALRQADAMAAILRKGHGAGPEELEALRAGLKKYAGDPLFAERLAVGAGARGALDFWADRARFEDDHELQKYLGLTLAEATRSDSPQMRAWERDMIALGDVPIGAGRREALGFQVMSNLMRWGQYDNEFLKEYGAELIRVEKELGENGRESAEDIWDDSLPLNRSGTDAGHDPMTGFMQALSKSPEAATEFFNGSFVTKEEDHEFWEDGDEEKGKVGLSNFQYLFNERDWPVTHHRDGRESFAGPDFMACAVEAAVTGRVAGEPLGDRVLAHTEGQARLMESVVASIAEDGKRLTDRPYMADSMGRAAVEYLPDISRALSDDKQGSTLRLYPVTGSAADLTHQASTRFLFHLGGTPEGNAELNIGHKIYMASLMDYHLDPNTPEALRYPYPPSETIDAITNTMGEVGGTLSQGRQEAILGPARESDKDFNDALSIGKTAVSGTVGAAIGVGATFIASPVGGALAGGGASAVTGVVIEYLGQQFEPEKLKSAGTASGEIWESDCDATIGVAQEAAKKAVENHRPETVGVPADWARDGSKRGLLSAQGNTSELADDLTTEISP